MNRAVLLLAAAVAVIPGTLALAAGIGIPPDHRALFGFGGLLSGSLGVVGMIATRHELRKVSPQRMRPRVTRMLAAAVIALAAYGALYPLCVVEHFADPEPIYFPLWLSGQAGEMVEEAGGRFAAIERYGPAAMVDAIARMPAPAIAVTTSLLLLFYVSAHALLAAVLAIWSVRVATVFGTRESSPPQPSDIVDVFLCHNSADKPAVRALAAELERRGLTTWLDQHELRSGDAWPELLELQIQTALASAIFIGPSGIGQWQRVEINALVDESVRRGCLLIPVLLPGAIETSVPVLLRQQHRVDLRSSSEGVDALARAVLRKRTEGAETAAGN